MNQTRILKGDTAPTLVVNLASAGNGVGADLVFIQISYFPFTLPCQVCDVEGTRNETAYTITAPNHCLLLCDLHIGMTIYGKLEENGEYAFKDEDDKEITAEDVICWQGKRV